MTTALVIAAVAIACLATVLLGLHGPPGTRTTSDFFVASRTVSPRRNAAAIGGEYLSAASFLGVAAMLWANGADMLWLPVGYTVGFVMLLVLVAAPMRRSGAYTLADFAESRLESRRVRALCSVLVVAVGWMYLVPQMQGAGLVLRTMTGAPPLVGGALVAAVVATVVGAGGMRSVTSVQATQFWVKYIALAVPALVLLGWWLLHDGARPSPMPPDRLREWATPLAGFGGREHSLYWTYSTMLALSLGTMGLPHVVVRYYTNRDGRAARRTTVLVVVLLAAFYVLVPTYGVLGRIYLQELPAGAAPDTMMLHLPAAVVGAGAATGADLLTATITLGAFIAFLSTSSGLVMSVAGVLDQDLVPRIVPRARRQRLAVAGRFRVGVALAVLVPLVAAQLFHGVSIATQVGLAFSVTASTFAPLLVLGCWWPRLSTTGALAGLAVGALTSGAAAAWTVLGPTLTGWPGVLLSQPALWSAPLAAATMIVASLATPGSVPRDTARTMVRLHTPEELLVNPS